MLKKQTNKTALEINEIEIPVPWGHVAGKTWGDENNIPILAFHGVQDNAGTFDRIIPYLPTSFFYICIDLPSHGKSSYFPEGLPIYTLYYVLTYKIIIDFLKLKKCIILGHSLGGQCAVLFTQLYPRYVLKLVILDTLYLFPQSAQSMSTFWITRFSHHAKWSKLKGTKEPPSYSYDEALKKLTSSRSWSGISVDAAKALLPRSLISVGNDKYRFSTDQRLKYFINPAFDMNIVVDFCRKHPICCPFLVILGKAGFGQYSVYFEPLMEEFRKNKTCKIEWVLGGHDVHNDSPEMVGPIIAEFLLTENQVQTKTWGDPKDTPVLALHGLQDNAGSFDRLIPLLPSTFYYICIDLPSHGWSSYYPEGLPIDNMSHVLALKIVADELKLEKFILMGHSLGGQISIMFSQLYPQNILKLIVLDSMYFNPQRLTHMAEYYTSRFEQHINWCKKQKNKNVKPPSYTYDEALLRLQESRSVGVITEEAARALLTRAVKSNGEGKYYFSADQRLKFYTSPPIDMRFIVEFLKREPIRCPMLLILASEGIGQYFAYIRPIIDMHKKNRKCIVKRVPGCHDVHNVDPQTVSTYISKFLTTINSKL